MHWTLVGALALGVVVGIISGLVGVGGGIVLVPALIFLFNMDQHMAQGTSLAILLPPTGVLAFAAYYKAGHVDWKLGFMIAAGVFLGGYFGGVWAQHISSEALRKTLAVLLAVTAVRMFFEK
ncbi:MAG: permease [Acidobacteria bacterium 13_1_40CM_4_58_4]|nr:MAG: permease [Acidobacteria bacterium 13_1_40CM_4_58_4]OLE57143.1 MAG: permease [Chloroflexi bacterium 13_1_20CM_2_59_7]HLB86806.1 sulfite exporter TauE/SafE family protein [Terriglobales bacterium]